MILQEVQKMSTNNILKIINIIKIILPIIEKIIQELHENKTNELQSDKKL